MAPAATLEPSVCASSYLCAFVAWLSSTGRLCQGMSMVKQGRIEEQEWLGGACRESEMMRCVGPMPDLMSSRFPFCHCVCCGVVVLVS